MNKTVGAKGIIAVLGLVVAAALLAGVLPVVFGAPGRQALPAPADTVLSKVNARGAGLELEVGLQAVPALGDNVTFDVPLYGDADSGFDTADVPWLIFGATGDNIRYSFRDLVGTADLTGNRFTVALPQVDPGLYDVTISAKREGGTRTLVILRNDLEPTFTHTSTEPEMEHSPDLSLTQISTAPSIGSIGLAEQEVATIENYAASRFFPDRIVVVKGMPLRMNMTRLHREHINKFTIEPFLSSTNFFPPGTIGVEQFIPDQTGEFKMYNVGHRYEADFIVVDTEDEIKRLIAEIGIQEFSLIHDLEGGRIVPDRIVVQQGITVRIYNTSLKGDEMVSIEPFLRSEEGSVKERAITIFEFTPDVVGEFAIRYEALVATATLEVVRRLGDANEDGAVNLADLRIVVANWGEAGNARADLNGDRVVDIGDLALVAINLSRGGP